jgi:hypothetical protein
MFPFLKGLTYFDTFHDNPTLKTNPAIINRQRKIL